MENALLDRMLGNVTLERRFHLSYAQNLSAL
jgi:hypothetical protein